MATCMLCYQFSQTRLFTLNWKRYSHLTLINLYVAEASSSSTDKNFFQDYNPHLEDQAIRSHDWLCLIYNLLNEKDRCSLILNHILYCSIISEKLRFAPTPAIHMNCIFLIKIRTVRSLGYLKRARWSQL